LACRPVAARWGRPGHGVRCGLVGRRDLVGRCDVRRRGIRWEESVSLAGGRGAQPIAGARGVRRRYGDPPVATARPAVWSVRLGCEPEAG